LFSSRQKYMYSILTIVLILHACSTPSATPPPLPTQEAQQQIEIEEEASLRSQTEQEAWNEDLDYFMTRLQEIHPDPFYRVSEEEYFRSINDLKAELPDMTDDQIIVELARIVAFIDGHSAINTLGEPVNFQIYPLRTYLFTDGVFVIEAQEPFENYIGGKIIQIGNLPITDVLEAVSPLIPHDNPMTIQLAAPSWIMRPEVLVALGIIKSAQTPQIVIEMPNGIQQTINPAPIEWASYREWARGDGFGNGPVFGLPERPKPLYLSRAGSESFWTTYLEDSGTLYIQYNRVQSGINTLNQEIREILDQQDVERVILDLRLNPGGNNTTYTSFLNLLSTDPEINRPGHFFTILGRQTFSAAANFATELENRSHTIFVGEPMGGSPNLYGDVKPITLPNSKVQIVISARYWPKSTPEDTRLSIEPDISTSLSSKDFFNNVDPSMKAILTFNPDAGYTPIHNPIIEPSLDHAWEAIDVRDPYVTEFEGMYFMFYAGQDENGVPSIGYATSDNGRKWFRSDSNPVLISSGEGFDGYGVTAPVVRREGEVWAMYYAAIEKSGARPTSIARATASSLDGPWERSDIPLITIGKFPAWDSLSITPGSVVDVKGAKRLYYSGFSANQKIGVGYAESVDGITWTKFDGPVMPGAERGSWDEIVYAPFVQLQDGAWKMFYHGDPVSSRETNDVGLGIATSTNGTEWIRADEPFLVSNDSKRFTHTPFALKVGDFIYVYYASVLNSGSAGQIEMIILPK